MHYLHRFKKHLSLVSSWWQHKLQRWSCHRTPNVASISTFVCTHHWLYTMPLLKYEAKPSIKLSFHLFVLNDCVWSSSFGKMWFLIQPSEALRWNSDRPASRARPCLSKLPSLLLSCSKQWFSLSLSLSLYLSLSLSLSVLSEWSLYVGSKDAIFWVCLHVKSVSFSHVCWLQF